MEPHIIEIAGKMLVGMCMNMTLSDNKTPQLWQTFMPRRKEIQHVANTNLFSLQRYNSALDFNHFTENTIFEKWAAVEVLEFTQLPEGMASYVLTGGLYAVFIYKGTPQAYRATAQYIFGVWLPKSGYLLDNSRAHFEILGEKYKNNNPESEEEVWIPIT